MEIIKGQQPKPVKGVFYGPEGVGKSSLAKDFPKPLYIDVEGGTSRLDVARTPRPTTWAHMKQILVELAKDQMGYETLVFDTADWLEKLAIKQVCAQNGFAGMGGNNDYGKSYNELAQMWSDLLTQLEADFIQTGKMHVVFLAHSTTKKFELPEEEGQFDRYQLDLEKKVAPLLKAWCDLMLFINYKTIVIVDDKGKNAKGQGGTRRVMHSEHTAAFDAKNRDGLPREMDLGITPLAKCFTPIQSKPQAAAVAPTPVVQPAPAAVAAPVPVPAATGPVLQAQHVALNKLMAEAGVTYEQLLAVLVAKGKYPAGTPLENIDPEIVDKFIFPHWEKFLGMINGGVAA
jgi:hypothetical protein